MHKYDHLPSSTSTEDLATESVWTLSGYMRVTAALKNSKTLLANSSRPSMFTFWRNSYTNKLWENHCFEMWSLLRVSIGKQIKWKNNNCNGIFYSKRVCNIIKSVMQYCWVSRHRSSFYKNALTISLPCIFTTPLAWQPYSKLCCENLYWMAFFSFW